MGKGDLWDDSALISAFDDAIAKYKVMHGKPSDNCSTEKGSVGCDAKEIEPPPLDEGDKAEARLETEDNDSTVASNVTRGIEVTDNVLQTEENREVMASKNDDMGAVNGSQMQSVQDYNHLLSQYYELEERRQQVLQQLHQFGGWNYSCSSNTSSSYLQWGNDVTSQQHWAHTTPASQSTVACSHCPYACCHCLMAPRTAAPACSSEGMCLSEIGHGYTAAGIGENPSTFKDSEIIKTAMGAAEKAISSIKKKNYANSNSNEGISQVEVSNETEIEQNASSETALTDVLNAWYSAGLYTGKYLAEQVAAKKKHS